MRTVSVSELRRDTAAILRVVQAGETYTVTRRGVPVAELGPVGSTGGLRLLKPATKRGGFSDLKRVKLDRPSSEILDELREERL